MGLCFKENCPDLRNTRIVDVMHGLQEFNVEVDVYDPWASPEEARAEYAIELISEPGEGNYDAVIVAVAHDCFKELGLETIKSYGKPNCVVFDVKYSLPKEKDVSRL